MDLGPSDRRNFDKQVEVLLDELYEFSLDVQVQTHNGEFEVACEYPEFFANQRGFHTAAGGDLVAMSYCVGRVAGFSQHCLGSKFTPVPVTKWKGQLPKHVVAKRIRERLDVSKLTTKMSHDWDACGIGLFVKGQF